MLLLYGGGCLFRDTTLNAIVEWYYVDRVWADKQHVLAVSSSRDLWVVRARDLDSADRGDASKHGVVVLFKLSVTTT